MATDDVDFAVAAICAEGVWQVVKLDAAVGEDVDVFLDALAQLRSDVGVLGFISIDDEFFVAARIVDEDDIRLLLSDVTAITDWPLASDFADILDIPDPDDEDEPQPAGDMDMLADLGMPAAELAMLCDNPQMYPDEIISVVARRLGFGEDFEATIA